MNATPMQTPPAGPAGQVVDAVQMALAGEHACVYGYGVVGAHLSGDAQTAARQTLSVHERRRDQLREYLHDLDVVPEGALPAYALPFPVDDADSARELAGVLEERVAGAYLDLVGSGPEQRLRRLAADALVDAALRRHRWTGTATAFPGLDERDGTPAGQD